MRRLGPYQLAARLSRGASGEVFLAWKPDEPGPFAAMKVFQESWSDDLAFARDLFNEASDAPDLEHPRLTPVLDVGRESSQLFVATELVGGQPLFALIKKARLEGRPFGAPIILRCFVDALDGMAAAHAPRPGSSQPAHVHGRLGPKDLMVTYGGQVRLLGFGLGRARRRLPVSNGRLPYVAPEVLSGQPPNDKNDVFSLAALLYEALTGRSPFRRATPEATRKALQQGDAAPIRPLQLDLAPEVSEWLMATLVPRPQARPGGVEHARSVLVSALHSEAPLAPDDLARAMVTHFAEEAEGLRRMLEAVRPSEGDASQSLPTLPVLPDADRPLAAHGLPLPRTSDLRLDGGTSALGEALSIHGAGKAGAFTDQATTDEEETADDPEPEAPSAEADGSEIGAPTPSEIVNSSFPWPHDTLQDSDFGENEGTLDVGRIGTPDLDRSMEDQPVRIDPDRADDELRQIARYRLGPVEHTDGPVQVRQAYDPNLDRKILLKLYNPNVPDGRVDAETRVRLFKREARYATRLFHPRFPTLLDAGRGGNYYFIVYERRPGRTLPQHLAEGRPVHLLELLLDLAEALQAVHDHGLVYGEIRPAHVRLRDERAEFGSVSTLTPVERAPHPLIFARSVWAPPELRDKGVWSPASDQHQLGVLAYRLLVDAHPAADPDRSADLVAPHELDPDVDPHLSSVVMRMLATDPADRYPDMNGIRNALRDLGGPSEASERGVSTSGSWRVQATALTDRLALTRAYANLARRAAMLALESPDDGRRFLTDPALVAGAVAQRLRWSLDDVETIVVAAAARALALRTRLSLEEESFQNLVPVRTAAFIGLMEADEESRSGWDGEDVTQLAVHLVRLAEAFVNRVSKDRIDRNPHRHLDALAPDYPEVLISGLRAYLTDLTQRADPGGEAAPRTQLLLAGRATHALAPALEDSGLDPVAVLDGHTAWEVVRSQPVEGVVVTANLPGRDGLSLLRLCRNHPELNGLPFWLFDTGLDESERRLAGELGALVVSDSSGAEMLRDLVLYRFSKGSYSSG